MINEMVITMIERSGVTHNFYTAAGPLTSDWLKRLCEKVFIYSPLNEITTPVKHCAHKDRCDDHAISTLENEGGPAL